MNRRQASHSLILAPQDVVLFGEAAGPGRCQLKNFLYFLNSIGARRPIKFSYVEAEVSAGPHHGPFSPREFLLDCVESVPWEDKELALKRQLEAYPNPGVLELLARASDGALGTGNLGPSHLKMLGLLKGMLRPADYLFLEAPEQGLTDEELGLFQNALTSHIRSTGQVVFIGTQNESSWTGLFNKRVERGPSMEFHLRPSVPEVQGHLRFNLPPGAPVKKIA